MKIDNEGNIDFGKITLPKGWNELDLKTYQEIDRFYSDAEDKKFNIKDVLHIFTGLNEDDINAMPLEFTEKIINKLSWLSTTPEYGEPSNKITIDGVDYIVNVQEKLKTGEYIALDTAIKQDKHNYALMLAILCRKEGEIYDSKFENEILPERVKLFEQQPMIKAMTIVAFFLNLWLTLNPPIQLYSQVKDAISLTANNIMTLQKNGEISKRSMKSAMKKLQKLKKSISGI